MLEMPKNYQEAKLIVQNSTNSEVLANEIRTAKLRALFAEGIGIVAGIAFGLINGDLSLFAMSIPFGMIAAVPFTYPYFKRKSAIKSINDDSYFNGVSEGEIMKRAEDFVRKSRAYEILKGNEEKKRGK